MCPALVSKRMLGRVWVVCCICFFSLSMQTVRLRESELYEGNDLEEEQTRKRSKTSEPFQNKSTTSIKSLSYDMLAYIFLFLHDPYKRLPFVSKTFLNSYLRSSPVSLAKLRFSPALDMSELKSQSLASKLLALDDSFLKNNPNFGCNLNTYLGTDLKLIQERTKSFLKARFDAQMTNFAPFQLAFYNALKAQNVDLLAELIEMAPNRPDLFVGSLLHMPSFKEVSLLLYQKNPSLIEKLNKLHCELRLLEALIPHPVPASFLLELQITENSKSIQNPVKFFNLASQSLAEERRPEDPVLAANLHSRNVSLIISFGELEGKARLYRQLFDLFNNVLYKPTFTGANAAVKLILTIGEGENETFQVRHTLISKLLLKFFILSDNVFLFSYVMKRKRFSKADADIVKLLDDHPEFALKLSYTVYSWLSTDVIRLERFRRQKSMQPITLDNPRHSKMSQLRLLAKYDTQENYITALKVLLPLVAPVCLLKHLLQDLNHPAILFFKTILVFTYTRHENIPLKVNLCANFWNGALAPKLFKSLLQCDVEDHSLLRIPLNFDLATALVDDQEIVRLHNTPRYLNIVKTLNMNNFYRINLLKWSPERLVKLFKALNFQLSFNYNHNDLSTINITARPSLYFLDTTTKADILPCLAMNIYKNVDSQPACAYLKRSYLSCPRIYDPLLLASYPLMNMWRLHDWESFFLNAPCVRAFHPVLDKFLLTSYYRQYPKQEKFLLRAFFIYHDVSFLFSIHSIEDAFLFVLVILPLIPEEFQARIKFVIHGQSRALFSVNQQATTDEPITLTSTEAFITITRNIEY